MPTTLTSQQKNSSFNHLLLNIDKLVIYLSPDYRILSINQVAKKTLGWEKRIIMGKNFFELCQSSNINLDVLKKTLKVSRQKQISNIQSTITILNRKNSKLSIDWSINRLKNDTHKTTAFLLMGTNQNLIDISKLKSTQLKLNKEKEKTKQALANRNEFIMNLSHDIRGPFTGVLGIARFLYDQEQDTEKKQQLGYIVQSSQKLLDLLNDIIDFSKIHSSKLPIRAHPFNIRELIDTIITTISASAEQKDLKVILSIDKHMPAIIIGDQARLHRILLNIVGNAVKYTEQGQILVSVQIGAIDKIHNRTILVFEIADTGIGIEKDQFSQIFKKFSRATSNFNHPHESTGLGLHIVKQFVDDLQGNITLESEVGKGSTFTCTVPFEIPNSELMNKQSLKKSLKQHLSQLKKSKQTNNIHFLIIEDDPIAQFIIKQLFKTLPHQFDLASTGKETLNLLKNNVYDLIITDIDLPDTDGISLSRTIRKKLKIIVPIIAVTAHTPREYQKKCKVAGINSVITKPINKQTIEKLILDFL